MINAAIYLEDLRIPPSSRLETLKGIFKERRSHLFGQNYDKVKLQFHSFFLNDNFIVYIACR